MQDTLFSAAGSQVDVDSRKHGPTVEVNPKETQGKESVI